MNTLSFSLFINPVLPDLLVNKVSYKTTFSINTTLLLFYILGFSSYNNNSANKSYPSFSSSNLSIMDLPENNNNGHNDDGNGGDEFIESDNKSSENVSTTIRLKFLDDTQRLVKTLLKTSVGDFKRLYLIYF